MGAWGVGSWDDDDPADFRASLRESEGLEEALAVDPSGDDLEAPDGATVIAAADVLAALRGHPGPGRLEGRAGLSIGTQLRCAVAPSGRPHGCLTPALTTAVTPSDRRSGDTGSTPQTRETSRGDRRIAPSARARPRSEEGAGPEPRRRRATSDDGIGREDKRGTNDPGWFRLSGAPLKAVLLGTMFLICV